MQTCSRVSSTFPRPISHVVVAVDKASTKRPDLVNVLRSCGDFREVRQLHAQFVVSGMLAVPVNLARLLESYVTVSRIADAMSVFEEIYSPDVFAYNTLMRGLIQAKCPYKAMLVFNRLVLSGVRPDNYSYTFVVKACSRTTTTSLCEGKQVHCCIIKAGIEQDTHVHSSLINMYATSGNIDDAERILDGFSEENTLATTCMISGYFGQGRVDKARKLFGTMATKDVATWSAMVTGYTKNEMYVDALVVFRDMVVSGTRPNESVIVSSLLACANIGGLGQGRWIHGYIDRSLTTMTTSVATALIHMYAKCGSIECGYQVFDKMPKRDVVTWGAIIFGFAIYGEAVKCFELFEEMVSCGIDPNEVVFVAVLTACSHGGYVREGEEYFRRMVEEFGIRPSIEHYGCMVDLFGRAGELGKAEEVVALMQEEPNAIILGSLLNACRIHNDLRRGRRVFRRLIALEPWLGDRYKLAGIMFDNGGEKEMAASIRKLMKESELVTTSGASFIEVEGKIHEFVASDHINHKGLMIDGCSAA